MCVDFESFHFEKEQERVHTELNQIKLYLVVNKQLFPSKVNLRGDYVTAFPLLSRPSKISHCS